MLAIMQMVKHQHDVHVDILFMSSLVPWSFAIYFGYVTFNTDTYNLRGSLNANVGSEHAACGQNYKVKSKSGGAGNKRPSQNLEEQDWTGPMQQAALDQPVNFLRFKALGEGDGRKFGWREQAINETARKMLNSESS